VNIPSKWLTRLVDTPVNAEMTDPAEPSDSEYKLENLRNRCVINKQQKDLKAKHEEISRLTDNLATQRQCTESKDIEIEQLKKGLKEREQELVSREMEIKRMEGELGKQKQELVSKDLENEQMKGFIANENKMRDAKAEKKVEEYRQDLRSKVEELVQSEKQLASFRKDRFSKDAEIVRLKNGLTGQQRYSEAMGRNLVQSEKQKESYRRDLESKDKEISRLKDKIQPTDYETVRAEELKQLTADLLDACKPGTSEMEWVSRLKTKIKGQAEMIHGLEACLKRLKDAAPKSETSHAKEKQKEKQKEK
jgi:chromosome segregation ATPase